MSVKISSSSIKMLTLAVATAMIATGCSKLSLPFKKEVANKPVELITINNPVQVLTPVFSTKIDGECSVLKRGNSVAKKDVLDLQIGVADNEFVVANRMGVVTGFKDFQKIWSVKLDDAITAGVAYDEASQTAIVSTRGGKVIALDGTTGQKRWETALNTTINAPALISGSRILLSANDGTIHGLNLQNGNGVWQFSTQLPNVSVRGTAKPLMLDASTALFGTADGRIHALNAQTGSPLWTRRVGVAMGGNDVGRMSDVDGTPLVVGNRLYVTSYSGNFAGFDMSTGQTLFVNREFASLHSVALFGNILVGVDTGGIVYGFNPATGEKLWKNNALTHRKPTTPIVVGEYVAIADFEGVVHLFDLDGNLVGRTNQKSKSQITSLSTYGNRLYAETVDGVVSVWQIN